MLEELKPLLKPDKPLVLCSKGIEIETGRVLSRVSEEIMPDQPVAVMTGPTFASEIARGLPGAGDYFADATHGLVSSAFC